LTWKMTKRVNDMAEWTDGFGNKVVGVHEEGQCAGDYCTIHKNSEHRMRDFKQLWRDDRAIMERVCEHGVGHPDPDEIKLRGEHGKAEAVHGCDGCCLERLEIDQITEAQELVVKILKNDGVLDERQRTLGLIDKMIKEAGWDKSNPEWYVLDALKYLILSPIK
jgi:hypothetical protein